MSKPWKYMKLSLNPEELPTMKELLATIVENGSTDAALAELREELRILLAKASCRNISREEIHAMIDDIYENYG